MKSIVKNIIVLSCQLFVLCACAEEQLVQDSVSQDEAMVLVTSDGKVTLSSPTTVDFPVAPDMPVIVVYSAGSFGISYEDWVTVESLAKDTLSIIVGKNYQLKPRSTIVYFFSSYGKEPDDSLRIGQDAYLWEISGEGKTFEWDKDSDSQKVTVDVTSSGEWTYSLDEADGDNFVHAELSGSTLLVTPRNDTVSYLDQECTLTVSNTDNPDNCEPKKFKFTRKGFMFDVGTESESFDKKGGTKSVSINSSVGWTASSSEQWISITAASGNAGEGKIEFSVQENKTDSARTGSIKVKASNYSVEKTITVSQK